MFTHSFHGGLNSPIFNQNDFVQFWINQPSAVEPTNNSFTDFLKNLRLKSSLGS